jgi:hypothetical protein
MPLLDKTAILIYQYSTEFYRHKAEEALFSMDEIEHRI